MSRWDIWLLVAAALCLVPFKDVEDEDQEPELEFSGEEDIR